MGKKIKIKIKIKTLRSSTQANHSFLEEMVETKPSLKNTEGINPQVSDPPVTKHYDLNLIESH